MTTLLGDRIAAYALAELVGTPYVHKGRKPGQQGGIDCFGVLIAAALRFDLKHEDFLDYDRDVDGSLIEERLRVYCDEIDPQDAQDGDVLLFWIDKPSNPQHFGIVCRRGLEFVHARERAAGPSLVKPISIDGADGYWRKRIASAWRYREAV